ncbi:MULTISPECIES: phage tail tape measure protein [Streptomyces]|uniref:Phage tail tape measure protein domain-containing protein n=2 Tax=Streptomyces TaxID=1883 RepID=A0A2U9P0L7_STRAS|nr:phage tail tape measure protein [Streptomyces actuosus]AWT43190.1 hypothetical protein DMT42_13235 [Streptomyces actuosus]MBM4824658.1 phage tail tape measure protein [Streptomyces actuosus]
MALTVGELNAFLTIDDRAVNPALRRAEDALRQTGQHMGDDAERGGQQAGQLLGQGLVRGADGQWRNMRGELVDAVTAAAADAEAAAHQAGRRAGQSLTDGVTTGLNGLDDEAEQAGRRAGDSLADGLHDAGGDGADAAGESIGQRLGGQLKLAAAGVGLAAGTVLMSSFQDALAQGQITAKLGAQLGTTPAVAQRYGKVAGSLFKDAIVADFQAGADTIRAVASAGLVPPGATNAQIKSIATNAADLASSFDIDVAMAAQAAGSAVKNGLAKDGKAAFDLLAKGMTGLGPASEDLVETFTEYGPIFQSAGLSGQTALGLIRQAIQGGWTKDTDKIADAFKEFQLRGTEGSKAVTEAFGKLGLDAKKTGDDIAAGGQRGEKAMDTVLDKLRALGPNSQDAKQIVSTLFGGPGEDLGAALFALDVDKASKAMGDAKGAADDLGKGLRDNAASRVTAFKNTMQQDLVEFLGTQVIPKLEKFFGFVRENKSVFVALAAGVAILGAAFSVAAIGVWAMNSALLANPMFWIVAAAVAVVAGAVFLIVKYWDQIKSATMTAWRWVVDKVKWAAGFIVNVFMNWTLLGLLISHWSSIKNTAVRWWNNIINWVKGVPGRIKNAFLNWTLLGLIISHWSAIKRATVNKAMEMVNWVRGLPGRISNAVGNLKSLLYGKGQDVVRGLWRGIQGMGGWLRSTLMGWARNLVPGPIAKALGIASPSKVMAKQVGRWIPAGIVAGIEGNSRPLDRAMASLVKVPEVDAVRPPLASLVETPAPGSWDMATGRARAAASQRVVLELRSSGRGADDFVTETLRRSVRKKGGGDVDLVIAGRRSG